MDDAAAANSSDHQQGESVELTLRLPYHRSGTLTITSMTTPASRNI